MTDGALGKHVVTVTLLPSGRSMEVVAGTRLHEVLVAHGGESPCGGNGTCRGCRVKVVQGSCPVTERQRELLLPRELREGWRLACQCMLTEDVAVLQAAAPAVVLVDDAVDRFIAEAGYGIAADIGTTTLAVQLVDLQNGRVRGLRTALNPQATLGADIMSRLEAAGRGEAAALTASIRQCVGDMIAALLQQYDVPASHLKRVFLVGNTVMHHLFCGLSVEPLSHVPFETTDGGLSILPSSSTFSFLCDNTEVVFLPCLGGFVGSDILAGTAAVQLLQAQGLTLLVDLGTNGEIVLGQGGVALCASTAAGPAFEGARISCGMRAGEGAIWRVTDERGELRADVIGNCEPVGICGSGLVDAVAAAVRLGLVTSTGRLKDGRLLNVAPGVTLTQADIRQLQLAKAAVSAGIAVLLERWGTEHGRVETIFLAGAFGNYISIPSAIQIGLFPCGADRITAAGNSALRGARKLLCAGDKRLDQAELVVASVQHIPLAADPAFLDYYVDQMSFPQPDAKPIELGVPL